MRFELLHPADQLVMIMNRIYYYGMTTTSGGNLSIKDDNGDIWITPSGIDKGNLTRADMCQVKPDGTVIGPHKPSVELPFHSEIYRRRPDLKGILHAHPPTLVAFSLARKAAPWQINTDLIAGLPGDSFSGFSKRPREVRGCLSARLEGRTPRSLRTWDIFPRRHATIRECAPRR